MAQHDYIISNGTGAAVRSDLNNGLAAIVSNNSGATEPATMYAYQWWADTTAGLLKQRNSANSAWITIGTLASANLGLLSLAGGTMTGVVAAAAGTAALPGIAFTGDLNTGVLSPGADQVAISTGGTSRLAVSTTAVSSTLAVDVPLGAVGTPSLTFTGDLNTGAFSPAADTLALVTAGTNRLHITSAGLVGIGTTSPQERLTVDDGSASATIRLGGNATYYGLLKHDFFGSDIQLGFYGPDALQRIRFLTQGTERCRLDASGRLLVGSSSATGANLLQVNSDALVNGLTVGRGLASASTNTAVGNTALGSNTTGSANTAIGYQALASNLGGEDNTAVGRTTLYENTSGNKNTAIGQVAGYASSVNANTTGSNNTFIGCESVGASATASNVITLGNGSIATLRCAVTTITALSDARDKTNITNLPAGLDFINALRPVAFEWNTRDGAKVGIPEFGFIAQELQEAQASTGITVPNLVSTENPEKLEASPGVLLPILINAVKQLSAQNAALEARLAALETA